MAIWAADINSSWLYTVPLNVFRANIRQCNSLVPISYHTFSPKVSRTSILVLRSQHVRSALTIDFTTTSRNSAHLLFQDGVIVRRLLHSRVTGSCRPSRLPSCLCIWHYRSSSNNVIVSFRSCPVSTQESSNVVVAQSSSKRERRDHSFLIRVCSMLHE